MDHKIQWRIWRQENACNDENRKTFFFFFFSRTLYIYSVIINIRRVAFKINDIYVYQFFFQNSTYNSYGNVNNFLLVKIKYLFKKKKLLLLIYRIHCCECSCNVQSIWFALDNISVNQFECVYSFFI